MTRTRVGLIGAGFVAGLHVRSLVTLEEAEVAAVADPRRERAETLAARAGARAYPDHGTMLAEERLDAVYICVPPFAHGRPELDALERGLPLFVEKPVALDVATAEAIAAEIERHGAVTATGYHWRYLDVLDRAREILSRNSCRLLLGYWLDRTPRNGWWTWKTRSGGQLIEQTTHLFDLARVLVGEVLAVRAEGTRFADGDGGSDGDILDVSTASLRFASGAIGSVSSTRLLRHGFRIGLELICDGLVVEVSQTGVTVDDGVRRHQWQAAVDPMLAGDRAFLAAVNGGADLVRAPYAEALRTHRVACAAAQAARDGSLAWIPLAPP